MTLGRYGNTGWGTAWIAALERLSTAWQNRLPRGKDYAEKGHVMQLQVHAGKITARVQGSRAKPYSTSIEIPPSASRIRSGCCSRLASGPTIPPSCSQGRCRPAWRRPSAPSR